MARVKLLFFGVLKDIVGRAEETVEIELPRTVGHLFDAYCGRYETLRLRRSSILIARNREFATPDAQLADNDEIAFLPPVSGGSSPLVIQDPAGHLFRITRDPIDSPALAQELLRPEDGAIITFEGVVRNNTKGRPTLHLEYECYEPMAIQQMARIGLAIAQQFSVGRIGMIHRLGRLEIGEASVAIIAAAPHRKAAFDAALEGINRLKREVPIWKKEFFADGAVWVDGEWDERLVSGSNLAR